MLINKSNKLSNEFFVNYISSIISQNTKIGNCLLFSSFKKHDTPFFKITGSFCDLEILNSFFDKYYLTNIWNFILYYSNDVNFYFENISEDIVVIERAYDFSLNIVSLSKPRHQLFLVLFKNKPIFIFTSGLMRLVINEKKKSSKKLSKVALSLIKLMTILILNKVYLEESFLKITNVGSLGNKILGTLLKTKACRTFNYIIINIKYDFYAQKLKTRRAIKKYIKKQLK